MLMILNVQQPYVFLVGQGMGWRVRGPVVKFSSLLALCDEGRFTEVVHK